MPTNFRERVREALHRAREFAATEVWTIGQPGEDIPRGFLTKQIRVAMLIGWDTLDGKLTRRAAALTFATLLSIIPFLAVTFFIINTFNLGEGFYSQAEERVEGTIVTIAEFFGRVPPDELIGPDVEETVEPPPPAAPDEPEAAPSDSQAVPSEEAPEQGGATTVGQESTPTAGTERSEDADRLRERLISFGIPAGAFGEQDMEDPVEWLVNLANQIATMANEAATDPRAVSIAGLLLIVTTVFGLMRNIEQSFNGIWGVRRRRSFMRTLTDYLLITFLLPFVAAIVLGATAALQSETVALALGPFALLLRGMQYILIILVFTSMYYAVPSTRVRPAYALFGGLIAGSLWVGLSWAYVELQIGLARYNIFYAGFAQFPMLLMWIYFSWIVLLLGAEISYAYQNEDTFAYERFADQASYAYREAVGFRAMIEIGRRFEDGKPGLDPEQAAKQWNVPLRLLNNVLDSLLDNGLISACAGETTTYQPRKPLDKIAVADVLRILREDGTEPSRFREDPTFKPLYETLADQSRVFDGATINAILQDLDRRRETLRTSRHVVA